MEMGQSQEVNVVSNDGAGVKASEVEVLVVPNDNKGVIPGESHKNKGAIPQEEFAAEKIVKGEMEHWTPEKLLKERQEASLAFTKARLDEPKFRRWLNGEDLPLLEVAPQLSVLDVYNGKADEIYENELSPEVCCLRCYGFTFGIVQICLLCRIGVSDGVLLNHSLGISLGALIRLSCCCNSALPQQGEFSKHLWYDLLIPVAKLRLGLSAIKQIAFVVNMIFIASIILGLNVVYKYHYYRDFTYELVATVCNVAALLWFINSRVKDKQNVTKSGSYDDRLQSFQTFYQFLGLYANKVNATDQDHAKLLQIWDDECMAVFVGLEDMTTKTEEMKEVIGNADASREAIIRAIGIEKQFAYEALSAEQQAANVDASPVAPMTPAGPRPSGPQKPAAPRPAGPQAPAGPRPAPARKMAPPPPKRMAPPPPARNQA